MMGDRFNFGRFVALVRKEFIQMRRDKLTFAMMLGVPLMQLILFGYAINADPKHLATAVFVHDHSVFSRTFITALQNSDYFQIDARPETAEQADDLLKRGDVQFVIEIPPNFSRDLVRGAKPDILVDADATDPAATGNAVAAVRLLAASALDRDLTGPLMTHRQGDAPFNLVVHPRYNAEGRTQYNIVPGIIGVILTMTMVMFTALAMTREIERGTMENLLTMPARPLEVMMGKIFPYIAVGYVQTALILIAARWLFEVPMEGSLLLLSVALLLFVAANLAVGFTFSTMAKNQLQAVQMAVFFFLPSILLSGFMFPFRGMPQWAQWLGEVLPLTHFLRIIRGILLKGNGIADIQADAGAIALFFVGATIVALNRYRKTLD